MVQGKDNELKSLNENRAVMYILLSRFYQIEADTDFLEGLKPVVEAGKEMPDEFAHSFAEIAEFINRTDIDLIETLAVDYAKVFLGVGKNQSEGAFPYESVYTSPQAVMMQSALDEVLEIYNTNGFEMKPGLNEPADHIFVELEFMAELCAISAQEDGPSCYETQKNFIKDHLLNWVPRFCGDVKKYADTAYYKAVAELTENYIRMDAEGLSWS